MTLKNHIDLLIARHIQIPSLKVNIFCPACKDRLHLGTTIRKKYETLTEHVSDPNQNLPWKPIFWCLTEGCDLNILNGSFFGYDGTYYGPVYLKPEFWYAIGSLSYWVEKEMKKEERRKKQCLSRI